MSNLVKRPSRGELEKRAYRLGVATAAAGVATIIVLVLAVVNVTSFGLAFLLALITAACGFGFKRTVGG